MYQCLWSCIEKKNFNLVTLKREGLLVIYVFVFTKSALSDLILSAVTYFWCWTDFRNNPYCVPKTLCVAVHTLGLVTDRQFSVAQQFGFTSDCYSNII